MQAGIPVDFDNNSAYCAANSPNSPIGEYFLNITIPLLSVKISRGSRSSILSDERIKVRTSHIIKSSIYHGETVDKTALKHELGYALTDANVKTKLLPQYGEKVLEQDFISPVSLITTPKGERVIDFGQNLAGYVQIIIEGTRGSVIEISHAEVLDKDGNFYTDNLRAAKAKNIYILSGKSREILKPTFSWQGFRYIRLDTFPFKDIDLSCFKAISVYSDIKRTGSFICGNTKINRLYHNIIWGQKSNFIDVPTDCPQRNERYGWTGDAQVFVRTAAINFDVEKFFSKWLLDLAAEQLDNGAVMALVPTVNTKTRISAAWADASVICPWEIYMAYGNKQILQNQFESMKKWVDYVHNFGKEEYLWLGGDHFGDWLAMDNTDGSYIGATSVDYIASAFFAHSTDLTIKAGKVLGYDMSTYESLYKNIVTAFQHKFIKNDLPISKTQTAYALALCFKLCTNAPKVADGLAKFVRDNGTKLTTGFVGTPYLLHALSENGYSSIAFDLLLQEDFPSWLYSVNHGATTMWEHWDGIKQDGTFWSKDMNSFNHYAYGAVYDWIFGVAAGIKPLEDDAGYKHILLKPHPDKRIGFLEAAIETRFGKLSSRWYYDNDKVRFEFDIPTESTAEIVLPDGTHNTVIGGKHIFFCL